ncbi:MULTISPECIES: TIGR03842 family LLM class F420-dependent oxidoreductase [unclassified Streptomyces]|uniref:TIGR03842 family LLM class F420-dependent oxidoreductase n=1 Tax=Streptomyces TaxID=1883 RepID=UPI00089D0ED2|nr:MULTISPECIES: TIGR03842 family LLM class F420-dependent oxidoreductase [unclassified Streptomyces]PJJ05453.1 putative F420-dependent oxidoreductase [Streptomyces sp. 2333.5]TXC94119.1 TIGR03842 family LLM class F420-dependent oxidoreductase [Streptomyces sp. ISID311]SEE76256.1 F420-dependent oxidoreductase, CPS_4043 family [Streptomyces sp. 2314.4]SEE99324.1 F420-dependent oxidoreductase, CPS_4043 family [Streptomyces sp. 2112.2]SOE10152.1 F420-dependent oxidoreductase, CPS_4043 family [Str
MDFGLVLQADPPASAVVSLMRRAERNGFRYGWTFDSAVLWQEPFVIYSRILDHTERLIVGPMVTNPSTRTPEVTASTFATLNEMYGNRTVCGIGRGDSAMRVAGRPPNTLARLGEAIGVIRDLAEGRPADVGGHRVQIPWIRNGKLPVWMGAYGPKALAMAGRLADGFILQLADPFLTEWMVKAVRQAAADAGRDPAEVTICVAAPAYVGDDLDHARAQCRWFGGMVGNHVADLVERYGEHSDLVPEELTEYIKAREGYDYAQHGRAGSPHADFVPDAVIDRFCLLGPVAAHRERLEQLRALGVDQFAVYAMHDAKESTIDAYGAELIPAFA